MSINHLRRKGSNFWLAMDNLPLSVLEESLDLQEAVAELHVFTHLRPAAQRSPPARYHLSSSVM